MPLTDQTARELTGNEIAALKYIGSNMDAASYGICRAVFPARQREHAAAGSAIAAHLRRKGLVMRGHCAGTWRLTERGRTALTRAQKEMGDG